jgi:hypothetical protein
MINDNDNDWLICGAIGPAADIKDSAAKKEVARSGIFAALI